MTDRKAVIGSDRFNNLRGHLGPVLTLAFATDGKLLAYISRRTGQFQLYVLARANGQEQRLSDTSKDESPSFSATSKYPMSATEAGKRGALAAVAGYAGAK